MKPLKVTFFGTPYFSARLLDKILVNKNLPIEILFVLTQQDKPTGRKKIITPSPVKLIALKHHIPVYYYISEIPASLFSAIDLCLVYSYGYIIPAQFLNTPRFGLWNIHPSLLPKYRGPSPIAYPLLLGDKETGVTLMKMDEKIDHGNLIAQEKLSIDPDDSRLDLEIKLTDTGYELFIKTVVKLISTKCITFHPKEQDHLHATYTQLLTKDHGFVALEIIKKALCGEQIVEDALPSLVKEYLTHYPHEETNFLKVTFNFSILIFNLYRALSTWPGIWTKVIIKGQEKRLKLTNSSMSAGQVLLPLG